MWLLFAVGSAFFAGVTAILAKCGIRKTDSTVATAIRTVVVLIFAWIMVFVAGSQDQIRNIGWTTLLFLILSGLATGAPWLCYFKALQLGGGILSHGDPLVVHQDAAGGILELFSELGHDGLLLTEDLCVGHLCFTSTDKLDRAFSALGMKKAVFAFKAGENSTKTLFLWLHSRQDFRLAPTCCL